MLFVYFLMIAFHNSCSFIKIEHNCEFYIDNILSIGRQSAPALFPTLCPEKVAPVGQQFISL